MDGTQSAAGALAAVGCNCAFSCGKRPPPEDAGIALCGGGPELHGAHLIAEIRGLEDRKSALTARQARLSVAFDLLQRREQRELGIPAAELGSALATVRTRLEVAAVLSRVPTSASDVGTTPMASEAVDRLLLALNNVIALRDT